MGELWIENANGLSCESNDLEGSSEARASAAEFDQYTEPCCYGSAFKITKEKKV